MIWKKSLSLAELNQLCQGCAVSHLGIEFSAQGDDWLEATVPVDHRTTQPFGLLHGGISAVLAETLGWQGHCSAVKRTKFPLEQNSISAT